MCAHLRAVTSPPGSILLQLGKQLLTQLHIHRPGMTARADWGQLLQGIETVRRDNCLLVRNVVTTCLERILMDKDVAGGASLRQGSHF